MFRRLYRERDQLMDAVKARLNETVLTELGVEVIDVRVKKSIFQTKYRNRYIVE